MGGKDFRTKPLNENTYTYYVFDNLRSNQDREGGDIFRYDTVGEAIDAFQRIQSEHPHWTIALGSSIDGFREIDYIQRRNGDNCLITDYQKLDAFKDSPEVKSAIETAMIGLKVDWQVDHELTGCSILIPHDFDDVPLDGYLFDMRLRPSNPENALTSIQEMYVEGQGWVDLSELRELAHFSNDETPMPPKVTTLNIAYETKNPNSTRTGYVDISPSSFRDLKNQYQEFLQKREATQDRPETTRSLSEVKTLEGWHAFAEQNSAHDFNDYVKAGDIVGKDMVDYFIDLLPPATMGEHLVQIGSSYESIEDKNGRLRPTFGTFAKEDGAWRFCGYCFRGERVEPAKDSWRDMITQAKEKAAAHNFDKPDKQRSKSHDVER